MSLAKDCSIVVANRDDETFLWQMLYYAAHMDEEPAQQPESAMANPALAPYVAGWGDQKADLGFIALAKGSRLRLGAAWVRQMPANWPLYTHIERDIPELAIAVLPGYIGLGVGSKLISSLIEAAKACHPAIALSVRHTNPAKRLYERLRFRPVANITNRVGGQSVVMKLELR